MTKLIPILFLSILLAGEMEVDGDLKVTGRIQNDSLAQVIANLQDQITALQNQVIQLECINNGVIPEGNCDCNWNVLDACGECGGDAMEGDACGFALSFGNGDEVWIPINPPNTNYTYSFNIKTEIDNQHISSTQAPSNGGSDREINITNGNIKHRLYQCNEIIISEGISVVDGNWHQVTITVENGIGQKIYIDGVLSASGTCSVSNFTWEEGFKIGSQSSSFFLDQLSLWNRALNESEINSIQYVDNYNEVSFGNELLGYWHFNEGSGMTVYDYSGNNYNGTISGNPEWVQVNP